MMSKRLSKNCSCILAFTHRYSVSPLSFVSPLRNNLEARTSHNIKKLTLFYRIGLRMIVDGVGRTQTIKRGRSSFLICHLNSGVQLQLIIEGCSVAQTLDRVYLFGVGFHPHSAMLTRTLRNLWSDLKVVMALERKEEERCQEPPPFQSQRMGYFYGILLKIQGVSCSIHFFTRISNFLLCLKILKLFRL